MMYDRMKTFIKGASSIVALAALCLIICGYLATVSLLVTKVINDLRLDTYVETSTGCSIVIIVVALVWMPYLITARSEQE
jgi:hypothetical protein